MPAVFDKAPFPFSGLKPSRMHQPIRTGSPQMACRPLSWPMWQVNEYLGRGRIVCHVVAGLLCVWGDTLGSEGGWEMREPQLGGLQQRAALVSVLVLSQASRPQQHLLTSSGSLCPLSHCWPRPSHLGLCPRKGPRRRPSHLGPCPRKGSRRRPS